MSDSASWNLLIMVYQPGNIPSHCPLNYKLNLSFRGKKKGFDLTACVCVYGCCVCISVCLCVCVSVCACVCVTSRDIMSRYVTSSHVTSTNLKFGWSRERLELPQKMHNDGIYGYLFYQLRMFYFVNLTSIQRHFVSVVPTGQFKTWISWKRW